ncbi:MAG: hypothetical protein Q8N23_11050 [Archangium sp.]|nr:hypothetical protein [Archangium sp.]MDP3153200.1 hypothetical protein [Archangium sp.]MDP3570234.1 hypothetical protein [Archangium sp.]
MAPRLLESKSQFLDRLRAHAKSLGTQPMGFGGHHFSHAVVQEEGVFRVRQLVLPRDKYEAWVKEHRSFMPEHAEMLSEPVGAIVLEAPTLDGLISQLEAGRWPY